ncbi:uncharacterized protein TRUGW13939_11959 [Talaromyces rugulosus]|uniref:LITAF domain-containing protein n=1 Tax=Talaromyces rugulosus TaxID=121627 RepID=A0A7H8RJF9_TALRU|nr:uncharacterized protein TRUGW13939_11959 [Talaromyces rugulosus]QKX64783.1 hypothetical protein TRUGW13939_11959 [Talaromyces rugulosus]
MEKQDQNEEPLPPSYSPPVIGSCPENTAKDITAAPPQQHNPEQPEKTATASPCNVTDSIVAVEEAPAKTAPAPEAPRVTPLEQLNEVPKLIDCPFCQYQVMTRVIEENSSQTTIAALLCCIFCGVICAFVPYLCKWAQEYHHFCGNCGVKVAIRPTDGPVQVQRPMPPPNYPAAPTAPDAAYK